jgi:heat-inducible transcriptional repressor
MRNLSVRQKQVLQAVIKDYILTNQPVGSGTLSKKYLPLSPATVRHAMGDLEKMGFLRQPHTSAGRVPTDRGLRLYVDEILRVRRLPSPRKRRIRAAFELGLTDGADMMKRAGHLLSTISNLVGLVTAPRLEEVVVRQMELVLLGARRVMVILIAENALVHNRIVRTHQDHDRSELDRMARYLNEMLSGLTLREMCRKIDEAMRSEAALCDRLRRRALRLGRDAVGASAGGELYVEEPTRILEQPEFLDPERMKSLFRALDEKSKILALLEATLQCEGVQVLIGSENELTAVSGCTLVASRYMTGAHAVGTLGVIGPTRMDYGKIIPTVGYVAQLVGEYQPV